MLVNLYSQIISDYTQVGDHFEADIQFRLPAFEFQYQDNIRVTQCLITWKSIVTNDFYISMSSSLVGQTQYNSKQQIVLFTHTERSNFTYYQPTHLENYKIMCKSLDSSEFKIRLSEKPRKDKIDTNIKSVYLQLEINGGIQQINSKSIC